MQTLLLTSLLFAPVLINGLAINARFITERQKLETYDYVVIGGGTAGITVGARLSEKANINVLVIEAGPVDNGEEILTVPGKVGQGMNTEFDWQYKSVVQSSANGRVINIPAGKLVGGASALNGMCFDRGAAADYNAWADLGNPGWTWDEILPYFKRNEKFTPPPKEIAEKYNITWDLSAHGLDGAIHSSYPTYLTDVARPWRDALDSMGIPQELDGHNGRAINMFWAPNSLDPNTMTRSYGKTGYYAPASTRSNFHILTNTVVEKLIHKMNEDGTVTVDSVQYVGGSVKVKREAIVSSGAIGTPRILQLSGFGRSTLLEKFNIPVAVNLPGVGSNYQDHPFESVRYSLRNGPSIPFPVDAERLYRTNKTGPWTASGPTFFAFLPFPTITSKAKEILDKYLAQDPAAYLPPGTDPTVVAGYAAQQKVLAKHLGSDLMGATEFIYGGGGITLSHQHEFSRGTVEIASTDINVQPIIDFRYATNPADLDVLVESIRWIRKAYSTPIMQALRPVENSPGASVTSDEAIANFVKGQMTTMYHSCCTAPMQPRDLGGVVDPKLKVYGTTNLRVADASVIPLIPGTHIQSTVYMIAEKLADMLLDDYAKFD